MLTPAATAAIRNAAERPAGCGSGNVSAADSGASRPPLTRLRLPRAVPDCHSRAMAKNAPPPGLRIRIVFGDGRMLGPGKAELLERIARTGSIAAAGREMRMSYKRAWMLIETLNAMFREPLVESTRGGPKGGGAVLTETGHAVLRHYQEVVAAAAAAGKKPVATLADLLKDIPEQ